MKNKIVLIINNFLLTKKGFLFVLFFTLLVGGYLNDYDYKLKTVITPETTETRFGIIDLEFADKLKTKNIIESWAIPDSVNTKIFNFSFKKSRTFIAKGLVISDFLFIALYSILLFRIVNITFKRYDLSFLSKRFYDWFKINREQILGYFILTIAACDIFENAIMLLNLYGKCLNSFIINFKIVLVIIKFAMASATILVMVFVNANKLLYDFLTDTEAVLATLVKPFSVEK